MRHRVLTYLRGFTLIEMAIVITLFGIVASGVVMGIPQYLNQKKVEATQAKMDLVMNALSVYAQRHYRLPCAADTDGANRGLERDNGDCLRVASNVVSGVIDDQRLYARMAGAVPWRALGLQEQDVVDGWGRYLTYKPAPHLTVNTYSAAMQSDASGAEIHNACRTQGWYDKDRNHLNRGKALFCCNAPPKQGYIDPTSAVTMSGTWKRNALLAAGADGGAANDASDDNVTSTLQWLDNYSEGYTAGGGLAVAGTFDEVYKQRADQPQLRASSQAVTLISHGSDGTFSLLRNLAPNMRHNASMPAGQTPTTVRPTGIDAIKNVWPPQIFAGTLKHPKSAAHDQSGLRDNASDDIVAFLRTDQIMAKAGEGSCTVTVDAYQVCSSRTYGNFAFLLDNSSSMTQTFGTISEIDSQGNIIYNPDGTRRTLPGQTRFAAAKAALRRVVGSGLIEHEFENDPFPGTDKFAFSLMGAYLETLPPNVDMLTYYYANNFPHDRFNRYWSPAPGGRVIFYDGIREDVFLNMLPVNDRDGNGQADRVTDTTTYDPPNALLGCIHPLPYKNSYRAPLIPAAYQDSPLPNTSPCYLLNGNQPPASATSNHSTCLRNASDTTYPLKYGQKRTNITISSTTDNESFGGASVKSCNWAPCPRDYCEYWRDFDSTGYDYPYDYLPVSLNPAETPDIIDILKRRFLTRIEKIGTTQSFGTPVYHSLLHVAELLGHGTADQPSAILFTSDGQDTFYHREFATATEKKQAIYRYITDGYLPARQEHSNWQAMYDNPDKCSRWTGRHPDGVNRTFGDPQFNLQYANENPYCCEDYSVKRIEWDNNAEPTRTIVCEGAMAPNYMEGGRISPIRYTGGIHGTVVVPDQLIIPGIAESMSPADAIADNSISAEQFFAAIFKHNFPNTLIHVVDMANISDMRNLATGTGGNYVAAIEYEILEEKLSLLSHCIPQ